ncbi:MAG: hypothetical protein ACR2F8_04125 [Caulobacteraceae bacterium]
MSDKLDFLGGQPSGVEEAAPEAQAAETPPAPESEQPDRPRGPDGKFAPKEPDAAAPADAAQPPLSEKETVGFYKAMADERDKRQALEKQLAELRARAEPAPPPSEADQFQATLYAQNLRVSRRLAEKEYGKDTVAEVHDWAAARCDADPAFNQQMRVSDDPYEAAKTAFDREKIAAEVSVSDLDQFRAWKAATAATGQAQTPPAAATPPPRSLATASGTGAVGKEPVTVAEGNAYAALFPT